jgi:MEMO1 family protein
MSTDHKLPALRPIEIVPFRRPDGEMYFALRDPAELAPQGIAISAAGYFVLAHLDGEHTAAEIQETFRQQVGMELPEQEILSLVQALNEALLLRGERVEHALAERRAAYRLAPTRDNRDRYPEPAALRAEIEQLLAGGVATPVPNVHGLIAPHLDYARGAPCYGDAYATLAQATAADRFVILGTNHSGESASVVVTTKDFRTPLGLAPTDAEFIRELEQEIGAPVCQREHDHAREHSIELQVHILQVIMGDRPFTIVPVLCPDATGPTGTAPMDGVGPDLADFGRALARLLAEADGRTVVIAGADLSHVGQRFHDPEPTTSAFLEDVARSDRGLLSLLEQRADEEFLTRIRATENQTRICSSGCIYTLLRALPDRALRVLSYHQAVDLRAETHVTCAAAVVS